MAENGGFSLIDLKGLSEPATKLIEVISAAVGAAYAPTHARRIAKATADAKIIAAKGEFEVDELRLRASARLVQVEVRRQKNIEAITQMAFEELPETASKELPSADWISDFFNFSQDVSDEQLQAIWARLLAGEVSNPGQFSTRTLQTLKTMASREASLFSTYCSTLCGFINEQERVYARVIGAHNNALLSQLLRHMDVIHLSEIGLIAHKNLRTIVSNGRPQEYSHIEYHDSKFSIRPITTWYNPLSWYAFLLLPQSIEMEFLTELGVELLKVANPPIESRLTQAVYSDLWNVGIKMQAP